MSVPAATNVDVPPTVVIANAFGLLVYDNPVPVEFEVRPESRYKDTLPDDGKSFANFT